MIKFSEMEGFKLLVKKIDSTVTTMDVIPGPLNSILVTREKIFVGFDVLKGPNKKVGGVMAFHSDGTYLWTMDISEAIKKSSNENDFGFPFQYSDGKYCVSDLDHEEWLLDINTGKIEFIPFQKPT
jgi:hypothetical protein